jgi:hypothetical protein
MNKLKKKIVWSALIMVAGIILFSIQMMRNGELNSTTGFAVGIIAVSIIKIIQFFRISKNPMLLKKFEISQKEERAITIAEKSGRFTFLLTILGEFIAICILILLDKGELSTIVSYVAAIQACVYTLTILYLNKKY